MEPVFSQHNISQPEEELRALLANALCGFFDYGECGHTLDVVFKDEAEGRRALDIVHALGFTEAYGGTRTSTMIRGEGHTHFGLMLKAIRPTPGKPSRVDDFIGSYITSPIYQETQTLAHELTDAEGRPLIPVITDMNARINWAGKVFEFIEGHPAPPKFLGIPDPDEPPAIDGYSLDDDQNEASLVAFIKSQEALEIPKNPDAPMDDSTRKALAKVPDKALRAHIHNALTENRLDETFTALLPHKVPGQMAPANKAVPIGFILEMDLPPFDGSAFEGNRKERMAAHKQHIRDHLAASSLTSEQKGAIDMYYLSTSPHIPFEKGLLSFGSVLELLRRDDIKNLTPNIEMQLVPGF